MKKILFFLFVLSGLHLHANAIEFPIDLPDGYELDTFEDLADSLQSKDIEDKQKAPSIQVLEAIPSAVVAGCVNALTGDYFESRQDLSTPGPVPLFVQRSWSSADKKWHFSHMPKLRVGSSKGGSRVIAGYEGDLGSGMKFRKHKGRYPFRASDSMFRKGLVNCALGEISGQTNWKNARIFSVRKEGKKQLFLLHGSRSSRVFGNIKKKGKLHGIKLGKYKLLEEHHPNGNSIAYSYTQDHRLKELAAKNQNQEILGTLYYRTHYSPVKKSWESLAGKVDYTFNDRKNKRLEFADLSQSGSCGSLFMQYDYDSKNRIVKRSLPSEQSLWIAYEKEKVKELRTRASKSEKIYATHRFEYGSDDAGKYTKVYDAEGNLTTYSSKNKRLRSICRYNGGEQILRESFEWTKEGSLISRRLTSGSKTLVCKEFAYDPFGNISKETWTGNLTGAGEKDSYTKTYLSSNDGWNLPLEENDGRKCIRFSYCPKSNLLKSRLTTAAGLIVKREFFHYDINGTLIEEIIDDGSSENPDDLTNVSERHHKKITPSQEYPLGLPEKVEELSLDLTSGKLQHLRTTTYTYSLQGKPLEERRYDQNRELAYTLSWKYDPLGNIIEETDAQGLQTFSLYDDNSNKISETKGEVSKTFAYDLLNRLIKEEETWADGTALTKTFRYNKLNQKIASTDPYGNETRYIYDPLGRLVETHFPPVETSPGKWKRPIEKTAYDPLGNPIEKQDAENGCTHQKYTAYGKPYFIQEPNGAISLKEYTPDGFLSKEIAPDGTTTRYTRDYLGRIVLEETRDADGALLKSKSRTYNAFHLLSEVDEEGVKTTYQYDPFGRLFRKTIKPQNSPEKKIEYHYDSLGRVDQTLDWIDQQTARATVQEYDLLDRVIEERIEDLNGSLFQKTAYSHDQDGNITQMTAWTKNGPASYLTEYTPHGKPKVQIDPEGNATHYHYTFNTHQEVRKVDPLGNQTIQIEDYREKPIEEKTLNALGDLIREKRNYYDTLSRLASRHTTVYQGNKPLETQIVHWSYDCMGNETHCIEAVGTPNEKTTSHTYNQLNQKISTLTPNGVFLAYQYDSLGRKIELHASDETVHYTYTYDLKDRPIKIRDRVHQTENIRRYDGHGRLTQEILDNKAVIEYAYDNLDRIVSLTLPDQNRIEYHYDPANLKKINAIDKSSCSTPTNTLNMTAFSQQ